MEAQNTTTNSSPTETPQAFTPEQAIEQLRALREALPVIAPLTPKERRAMRSIVRVPSDVVQAQIDVLAASGTISVTLNVGGDAAQQMANDDQRWTSVETEVQSLLNALSGGNLLRKQKLQLLGAQAFGVGKLLARSAEHAELKTHLEKVRRLKRLALGRKSEQAPSDGDPQQPKSEM